MRPVYRQHFEIRSYETDPQGRLQPAILCRLLQEAAVAHANNLEVGVQLLIDHGVAWVLTRLRLDMQRWPGAGEELVVTTWPEAASKLFTERQFRLTDATNRPVGAATTLWLMIDLEQRRAIRFPAYVADRLTRHDLGSRPARLPELTVPESMDRELTFTVRRTDLDLAGHVNNTSYIEWAVEAVSDEIWDGCDLARLDVQFISECHHGQTVLSGCRQTDTDDGVEVSHQILRQDDNAETARAYTVWKRRP